MDRPSGLAYDTARDVIVVGGDDGADTRLVGVDRGGRLVSSAVVPRIPGLSTLAFDARRDRLASLAGGEVWTWSRGAALDVTSPASRSFETELASIDPQSAAFDPSNGRWFILSGDEVLVIAGARVVGVISLDDVGSARAIAVDPEDGLLYAIGDNGSHLAAVDDSGSVVRTYDLSGVSLSDPVAITFAPSSDPTDDPSSTNLFVADAGSTDLLGGVTEVSLVPVAPLAAPVDAGTLVRVIATSAWTPASPDPSGVAWAPDAGGLIVVDSEVEETTGAGWHDVNMWVTTVTGSVVATGTFWGPLAANGGFSKEPTGAGYDQATNTLFVSDDSAQKVWVIRWGPDRAFGTSDDAVTSVNAGGYGSGDTEDPEFLGGQLFFLDGIGREIYRIDPVDSTFGNGNDVMTHFDISHLGPTDFEGLASSPGRGTLYVGARTAKKIFEIATDGTLIRTIDLGGISGMGLISGLAVAPASNGSGAMSFYIVDRAVDNGANSQENDGRLLEIAASDIGGGPVNGAPVAVGDSASTAEDTAVVVSVLANDSDPDGDSLSVVSVGPAGHGSVVVSGGGSTVTYTPAANYFGPDSFSYVVSDGLATASASVSVSVSAVNDAPVAVGDSASTAVGTPVVVSVLANDFDVDSASLSVVSVGPAGHGSVVVSGGGSTVTYTPAPGYEGTDSFTYQVSDGALSATATVTVAIGNVVVAQFASSESTVEGSRAAGDLADTRQVDGVVEQLVERQSGGPPSRRTSSLDHRWNFVVQGGDRVEFVVRAARSDSADGDNFAFEYSTDGGGSFTLLTEVLSSTFTTKTVALPAATSGSVVVRVRDTDRQAGHSSTDSVFVDYLAIETLNPQAPRAQVTVAAGAGSAPENGGPVTFTFTRDDVNGPLTVSYAVSGTASPDSDFNPPSGSLSFASGESQASVSITLVNDDLAEPDESLIVSVLDQVEYTVGQPGAVTVIIVDDDRAVSEARAVSETLASGAIVSGTYLSTYFDDADFEVLSEEWYAGNSRTRLEHTWTFSVSAGSQVTFRLQAHHDGTEPFVFSYSLGGNTWTQMLTVTKTGDDGQFQTFVLPPGTSGTVYVRVTDASRDRGDSIRERVFIDAMSFVSVP